MDTTFDLVRWDVPFAEAREPGISLITERGGDAAMLVVAPSGIDRYPKYLVRFENVIALLCYEEAFAFDRGYSKLSRNEEKACAYRWIESSWLQDYRRGAEVFTWKDMRHYLIFGGDSIVELLVCGEPKVERIDAKILIAIKHEV